MSRKENALTSEIFTPQNLLIFGGMTAGLIYWLMKGQGEASNSVLDSAGTPYLLSHGKGACAGLLDRDKAKIVKFIALAESNNNYALINDLNPAKEFSYGIMQANFQAGTLANLLEEYAQNGGIFASALRAVGDWRDGSIVYNSTFKKLLKDAGNEDPIMRSTQNAFFTRVYLRPAWNNAKVFGFKMPVSYLVMASSAIQFGLNNMLYKIKEYMQALKAENAGDIEKDVIRSYIKWQIAYTSKNFPTKLQSHNDKKLYALLDILERNPCFASPITYMGRMF